MVFHCKEIYDIIKDKINNDLSKSKKKLKFTYIHNILFDDIDICKMICDRI